MALKQAKGWTCGIFLNHVLSLTGDENRADLNGTFMQPFLTFITQTETTFGLNSDFEKKWLGPATDPPEETLVGTADLQSLADLASSFQIVQGMRGAPASLRLIGTFASAALLPVLPLFLLQYPAVDLVKRLFMGLPGL